MLPAAYRLRASAEFASTTRKGKRVPRPDLVLHFLADQGVHPRVGYVVSKAIGGSVTRHAVSRKLRAATRPHLEELTPGTYVIRALPSAAERSVGELSGQIESALAGCE